MGSMTLYILFICIEIPLLISLVLFEKKARLNVFFFLIGAFMCVFVSSVNSLIRDHSNSTLFVITTSFTPITEEIVKALPVVIYAFLFSDKRKTLISISMATGIGFAILENAYILMQNINSYELNIIWAVSRVFGASLMHAMCTSAIGLGCSLIRKRKKLFYTGTFALAVMSITYHGIFNALVQSKFAIIGYILPVVTFISLVVLNFKDAKLKNRETEKPIN